MNRKTLSLVSLAALSACSLAPKYVQPDLPVPPSWPVGDAYLAQNEATLPSVSYRDIFRDPRLQRVIEAAVEAARIRLRPILMTSFAFIFGVLPLAIATGAGANSRAAIGTAVIGGMLTAAFLAIFFIPLFFVLVRRGVRDGLAALRHRFGKTKSAGEAAA